MEDFSELYVAYYPKLIRFAKDFVPFEEDAENLTQDVFLGLWERWDTDLHIENMNAYLYALVRNRCLDYLRHKVFEQKYAERVQKAYDMKLTRWMHSSYQGDTAALSERKEMEQLVRKAIDSLPKRCRDVFLLSRVEGLKYKEISIRLGISVNTVECQIVIALKKLRARLYPCLSA